MSSPFEHSLSAALLERLARVDRPLPLAGLALDELVIDLPAGRAGGDPAELAGAVAAALAELLAGAAPRNRGEP